MIGEILLVAAAAAGPPPSSGPAAEIIVTGERVRRSLKETPSSVHVETRAEIEARPADRVEDVLAFVPNLQLGSGSEGPTIRGQDTTGPLEALPAFLGGNRPRATVVVDGRAVTYNEFVFGAAPLWDVNRVEVFRTPQTTTQGQNSIAGAIFVDTNDPTFTPEYRARGILGDFKTRQVSALASGPLIGSGVAFRLAGDLRYSRRSSVIADRAVGADPNHDVYGLLRAKLLAQPSWLPGTKLILTYAHQQSQAPQVVYVTPPFRDRRDSSGFYGTFRIEVDSLTAAVRHEGERVTANILVTTGNSITKRLAPAGLGQADIDGADWSGEAVVNWSAADDLKLTGGASRRHTQLDQRINLSVLNGVARFRDWQDGTGLFGEANFEVGRLTFTGGLRYQRDSQKRVGGFDTAHGLLNLDYDRSFDAWLPKASIAYRLSSQVTAGVLVEKAYNPGGTTLRFDIAQPDNFKAERLWDYEGYVRASMAGGSLTAEANAFYYALRNAQRSKDIAITAPNGQLVGFSDLFNVPLARSYGLEGEMRWTPDRRLALSIGLGLLRSRIVRSNPDYPEFEGNEFGRAPHLTASAAVRWSPTERFQLSAQARHHSGYWSDPTEDPAARIGAGTIVDARAEYRISRGSVFAYARNVFNSFALVSRQGPSATLEDPREAGVGIEVRL